MNTKNQELKTINEAIAILMMTQHKQDIPPEYIKTCLDRLSEMCERRKKL